MKTIKQILEVLNLISVQTFMYIYDEFGCDVFTLDSNTTFDDVSAYIDLEDNFKNLKSLNIEIIISGRTQLDHDSTQIVISVDSHLFAADGYYSSYDSDDYDGSDWYVAKEQEVIIKYYNKK